MISTTSLEFWRIKASKGQFDPILLIYPVWCRIIYFSDSEVFKLMLKWHWKTCTPGDLCQSIFLHSRLPILQSSNQTWFLGHAGWAEITHQHSQRVCLMFQIKHSHSHHPDQCKRHKLPISSDYPSWIFHGINSSNFTEFPNSFFFWYLQQNKTSSLNWEDDYRVACRERFLLVLYLEA